MLQTNSRLMSDESICAWNLSCTAAWCRISQRRLPIRSSRAVTLLIVGCSFLVNSSFAEWSSEDPQNESTVNVLAFSSTRDDNSDIFTMNADGTDLHRVTSAISHELEPSWSADGSRIAFQSRRPHWMLFTSRIDGTDEVQVTSTLSWSPSWSPNGDWIAYSAGSSIARIRPSGTGNEILIQGESCGRPVWSPDGAAIAFHSTRSGNPEIYVLEMETGEVTPITDHPSRDLHCSWSPDGQQLVFASDRDGDLDIYTTAIDRTHLVQLTDHAGEDMLPSWSPDGTLIAFVSSRDGNREIYSMLTDGSCVTRLTDNPGEDMYPVWQPLTKQQAQDD